MRHERLTFVGPLDRGLPVPLSREELHAEPELHLGRIGAEAPVQEPGIRDGRPYCSDQKYVLVIAAAWCLVLG